MTIWQLALAWLAPGAVFTLAWVLIANGRHHQRCRNHCAGLDQLIKPRNPQQRVAKRQGEGWGDIGAVHHGEAGK